MSFIQAIRGEFLFFQGSAIGGTSPTGPIFKTLAGDGCSSMLYCACLMQKTIEIRGNAADFVNHTVQIEATISETANDKASWFAVSAPIAGPGLYTVQLSQVAAPAVSAVFYEPELTWLRVRAITPQAGPGVFPTSIGATMAGIYNGHRWETRIKGRLGQPAHNSDYKAV